ncbi:MAG TPA: DUF296 domain-containing protein [Stellaceae bacterium]|nr:DUF296 domain-containing protein [Stellaceae bacterium]
MANTAADQFVATLAAAGVKRIYGVAGDSLNGLTDPGLSRRVWLAGSAAYCCLASTGALAADAALPAGYTPPGPPQGNGAPGLRAQLVGSGGQGRTWLVILAKGDEVMSGLTRWAETNNVRTAHLTAIGAAQHALFGWFDRDRRAYRDLPVNQQCEIASLVGDIGLVENKPQLHIHAVVGLRDGTMRGGHLVNATVWPTLEVFVQETAQSVDKHLDSETGLDLFHPQA